MTAPALAQFALKYDCPIVPVHAVREGGFRFRIVVEPPLDIRPTGDRARDFAAITTEVNRIYHLDRGYERLHEKLAACGADIERLKG